MILFTVILFALTSINRVYSVMPVDLPFYAEEGNWLIKATLNSKNSEKLVQLEEYIQSVNGTVTGKIVVKVNRNVPSTIYYKSSNLYERLFVAESNCILITYADRGWTHFISGMDTDNFATHLILVGPSILFRINKSNRVWKSGQDDIIRGVKRHSASTALDRSLDVWYYYKGDSLEGLARPTRILFSGYDPMSFNTEVEQYWFDYYIVSRVEQNFNTIVTPKPGLVCNKYFTETSTSAIKPSPRFNQNVLHFITKTKSFKAGPEKKEEVYADERFQILRIKSSTLVKDKVISTTYTIYDYQLGLAYTTFKNSRKCFISPMNLSAPGIVRDSSLNYGNYKLDLNRLLELDQDYRYLGSALFEDRNEIGIKAWERFDKSFKFGGKNFQNVIKTQYIREATDKLVGTTFKAHDKETKKLTSSLSISYHNFDHEISPSDSMEKFSIKDCYRYPEDKKTIAFYFTCPDSLCDNFNQYYRQIQDKVEEALIVTRKISASRISNIVPIIDSKEIIVYVSILNFPNIKDAFQVKIMKLSNKLLTDTTRVIVDGDVEACLRTNSYKYQPFTSIAFCETENGNLCQKIDDNKVKLVEDAINGTSCLVYMTPLRNVYRYSQESLLDNVHMELNNIEITLTLSDKSDAFKLKPYHVTNFITPRDDHYSIYETIIPNTKLNDNKLVQIVGTIDLSLCHRKCVHSTENDCRSFSFCTYPDKTECFLSTIGNVSSNSTLANSACGTYFINNLTKFKKISSKKFTNIVSVPIENSLEKCSSLCYNTDSCKSFQYCSGSCSLSSHYTDTSSVYSETCDIYIPNVLNRFELTGKLVVENVFHTELNMNVEQCAALCYKWKDNDAVCQSFSFCSAHGKTSSLCHLSKYSTLDTNEKLIHSDSCQNYERFKARPKKQQNGQIIYRKPLSFGSFYWISTLLAVAGLVSGIIASIVYSKLFKPKNKSSEIYNRNTFSWTKQLNDERQSVATSEALQMPADYAVIANE